MKIALLTIWHEKNYGAEMQAYATIKVLKELGHEVEMIDFRLSDRVKTPFKRKCLNLLYFFSQESQNFRKFWCQYFPVTRRYRTIKSIRQNPPKGDVYLVGSDQVWNPEITKDRAQIYFLDFGDRNIKRISYASSFGVTDWDRMPSLLGLIETNLRQFDAISCRESSGVNLLQSKFAISATNVLDPTLLFAKYPELIGEVKEKESLVFYPLSPFPELESFAKQMSQNIGLEYINTNLKKYLLNRIIWRRPSVEEWIRNIASASLVVTPSFHGLAFSLIYHRQFIIVAHDSNRSSRITNLLDQLGLQDRYFTSVEGAEASKIWQTPIDYSIVEPKLSSLRASSIDFLKTALR